MRSFHRALFMTVAGALTVLACVDAREPAGEGKQGAAEEQARPDAKDAQMTRDPSVDPTIDPMTLTDAEWKAILTPERYRVLRQSGTERAGTGPYLEEEADGAYHCAGCGQKLYGSEHKFHSGCGWPSFNQEVEPGAISTHRDTSHFMVREEMRCARCGGHLGHIFADAPDQPTGNRHCVNGTALIFVPEGEDVNEVLRADRKKD